MSTSRKACSPAEYQKECSIATARSNCACTFGSQLVGNDTFPSGPVWESVSCACAETWIARATTKKR